MVKLNGVEVPTCSELAKMLEIFGDQPLFSGNGWYTVFGFGPSKAGVQVAVKPCPPEGHSSKELRNGGV